ncbi:uncharacterized protein WCC33_011610 [Rhinophrynus dorsalis]
MMMALLWIGLHFGILFVPWVISYGFRNCIQSYENAESYSCVYRFMSDVQSAVSDLPNNTKYLNLSNNRISTLPHGSFQYMPLLQLLRLEHNTLKSIDSGAFDKLTSLHFLDLSYNNISSLLQGVFRGLVNLKYLNIQSNSLAIIHTEVFGSLVNLEFLNLSCNHLNNFSVVVQSIQSLQKLNTLVMCSNHLTSLEHTNKLPFNLTRLYLCMNQLNDLNCQNDLFFNVHSLDLSYNNMTSSSLETMDLSRLVYLNIASNEHFDIFKFITKSKVPLSRIDYSGLKLNTSQNLSLLCNYLKNVNMSILRLLSNNITQLDENTLNNCNPRNTLDLSRNKMKYLNCLQFMKQSSVESLIVEHNLLKKLTNCKNKNLFPNLQSISFRYNRIWTVDSNAFGYAPNLQKLHLNINNIIFFGKYAFSGLNKLTELRLDNNLITDLYESSFEGLTELKTLNLRNNRVSVIFKNIFHKLTKLTILDLGGNKITRLENKSLYGLQSLSKLYLDNNQIKCISSNTFYDVETTLQVLDLKSNKLYFDSSRQESSPFFRLNKLYDLKLQAQQPYGLTAIPKGFFKGLTSLRSLYLAGNHLSHLNADVFKELGQLTYLSLAEDCNGIQNLPADIFKNLTNLHVLDLENICLQDLKSEVFNNLINLKKLHLTKNALKHINVTILENMSKLQYLDLRKCPLSCSCNNQDLQMWLKQTKVQVVYFYNLSCPHKQDSYFYNFDTLVCDREIKVRLFSTTFPTVLLFIIIPIVYSKCYWLIKYNYFLFLVWLHERWKSDKDLYKYDAFVSYNTHDEEWVYKVMLPMLENCNPSSALRLCLHHRDFQVGRDIIDNIVDSIHNSRKTICVISRSYLQSEWCSLEMQLASYKLFDEMRDVLVLIFLENIPDRELSTYHRMRKVMLKKTYISWPSDPEAQKLFWAKVTEALSGRSSPEEDISQQIFVKEEQSLIVS